MKTLILVTTLLDAEVYTKADLAELYRARLLAEVDLRSLKATLQMDVLRCKSPDVVRKEAWTHLLAYNLVRTVIAQTAGEYGLLPREISFKRALQTINAFWECLLLTSSRIEKLAMTWKKATFIIAIFAVWFVVNRWVLPRFGVGT